MRKANLKGKTMNRIKTAASATKKFVVDHKIGLAVIVTAVATAAVALKLNEVALKDHNDFLREEGLYDKFYTLPEAA